ncbi:MAG: hypothetical protein SNJ72_07570, partial [Fimbriimonadales bacterium]
MKRFAGLMALVGVVVLGGWWFLPREPRTEAEFLAQVRQIVRRGDVSALRALGENAETLHWHGWLKGKDRLPNWSVSHFPAPKGYGAPNERWLVFHKFQLVQELCDRVHPIRSTAQGFRLGAEVPESVAVPFEIAFHDLIVRFEPKARKAIVRDRLTVRRLSGEDRALLMRLNAPYKVISARYKGRTLPVVNFDTDATVPPSTGYWLGRAGGIVWLQGDRPLPNQFDLELNYEGVIWFLPDDRVSDQYALLCSYWYPHIGRLPARHRVRVHTAPNWRGFAQGNKLSEQVKGGERITVWQNDLPVCFFSVVVGPFEETAVVRSARSNTPIRVFQIGV